MDDSIRIFARWQIAAAYRTVEYRPAQEIIGNPRTPADEFLNREAKLNADVDHHCGANAL